MTVTFLGPGVGVGGATWINVLHGPLRPGAVAVGGGPTGVTIETELGDDCTHDVSILNALRGDDARWCG